MSAVNPALISNSFNATSLGENIIQTYYRLRYYLEEDQLDIRVVMLPVDLHSFSSYRMDRFSPLDYWRKYINFLELGETKYEVPKYLQDRLLGQFSYYNDITNTIDLIKVRAGFEEGEDELIRGFKVGVHDNVEKSELLNDARSRVRLHFNGADPFDPDAAEYFSRLLDLLDDHHVKAVLIAYPVIEDYYRIAGKQIDIPAYYADLQDLLYGRPASYPLLDYHDVFWGHDQYFSDADHLNATGANQFTELLAKDLEDLGYLP